MSDVCDVTYQWDSMSGAQRREAIEDLILEILGTWGIPDVGFTTVPPPDETADGHYDADEHEVYLGDAIFDEDRGWERAVVVGAHESWHVIETWLSDELGVDTADLGVDTEAFARAFADSYFTDVDDRCFLPGGSSVESSSVSSMTASGWVSQPSADDYA